MIVALAYIVVLATIMLGSRKLPTGPFLLANAYGMFLTLPCALAYYYLFGGQIGIEYGQYDLQSSIYVWIFCFQASVLLAGYGGYRSGFRYGERNPSRALLHVNAEGATYRLLTALMVALAVGILLYVHAAFDFAYLFEPRRLYEVSREGYGTHYFALGFSLRLAALLLLMSNFKGKYLLFAALMAFSVLTGAKVNTYIIAMFATMYFIVFRRAGKVNGKLLISLALIALPLVYLLIWLTFQDSEVNILELLVAYVNEPWNNFSLLVQTYDRHFHDFFLGKLTLENNIISRIPRPLFPEKPYLFGGFRLADEYFPETVALGIGAPSFGAEGIVYADWGVFGLLMLLGLKWLLSWMLGRITCLLTRDQIGSTRGNFLYFGMLLIMADLYFLTLPPSNNLVDNLFVVAALSLLFGIRRQRTPTAASSQRLRSGELLSSRRS
jgi:hypothetical protein